MHRVSGLHKAKEKKKKKKEITGHVDVLDILESCLQDKEDKYCVVAEKP